MPHPQASSARPWHEAGAYAVLVVLPVLAYLQLAHAGFLWDDDAMLAANPLVRAADGLRRIWFSTQALDYWPVTYSSFWAEWRLWGTWAPGYHLTNVLLHVVTGLLLWRLLVRIKLPGAFFAALWFSLHPLNVESVAWIAQRKNLLAMVFFLLSLRAFVESSVVATGRWDRWSGLAWVGFLLALLSKGSVAPLPFVLVGWVVWHRRLRWRDLGWVSAFFLTAAVMVALNIWFSHKSGGEVIRAVGWPIRIAGAGAATCFYLSKILVPMGLCFVYPNWTVPPVHPLWWLGVILALAVTLALWRGWRRGAKPELWAWLYFVAMLLPVLGLVDVYFMKFSLVADHYAHLAMLGVLAWAAARLAPVHRASLIGWAIALVLGVLTFQQTEIYQDNFTLFRSVLARNPHSWIAHNNLGYFLELSGHPDQAEPEYRAALAEKPDAAEIHDNLGRIWAKMPGRLNDAVGQFQTALDLAPANAQTHYHLANVWLQQPGRQEDAVAEYQAALRLDPDFPEAHFGLANAWVEMPGRLNDAIIEYQTAIRLNPNFPEAHNNLGDAWLKEPGHAAEAAAEFETAVRLKPDYVEAHYNLGNVCLDLPGRLAEATEQFQAALQLRPDVVAIRLNLAIALLSTPGRTAEAVAQLQTVLRMEPGNPTARQILAQVQASHP